jgi:membrane associated rhomboid family serine protease
MIPLRDNIPSRTTPVVNYAMIGLCVLTFLAQLREENTRGSLIERYGMIPKRVLHPTQTIEVDDVAYRRVRTPVGIMVQEERATRTLAESSVPPWLTLLTCLFLHGGWTHFLGNLWFLHIFGDNVEDRFGHWGYLLFYLGCGFLASVAHLVTNLTSSVPTIGASGAIAGVMGAYFLLYPRAKVLTLVPIFVFLHMLVLPAPLFLGVWFAIQFFQGTAAITTLQSGGVAWWAHIGGFVAGLFFAWQLQQHHKLRPPVERVMPYTDRTAYYRLRRDHNPWS